MQPNKKGFFSMEAILGFLILVVIVSWDITFVMKSASFQDARRNEDLAKSHIEFVLSQLRNAPFSTLADDIHHGVWNYTNVPAIIAAGLAPLPSEFITTECSGSGPLNITVTLRWQNRSGQAKEEVASMTIGGS